MPGSRSRALAQMKTGILHALTKLEDRDTASAATKEIQALMRGHQYHRGDGQTIPGLVVRGQAEYAPESLSVVLSALISGYKGSNKAYVRRECLVALRLLCSEDCPVAQLLHLSLGKAASFVCRCFRDGDTGVRNIAVDIAGSLAMNAANHGGGKHAATVILKAVLDTLSEQNKEVHTAACKAIEEIHKFSESLCNILVTRNSNSDTFLGEKRPECNAVERLARLLSTPNFLAHSALLHLFGYCDSPLEARGLIVVEGHKTQFRELLPTITSTAEHLLVEHSDWHVRASAASFLQALITHLGPKLLSQTDEGPACTTQRKLASALESARSDRITKVRSEVSDALIVMEALSSSHPFMKMNDWKKHLIQTRKSAKQNNRDTKSNSGNRPLSGRLISGRNNNNNKEGVRQQFLERAAKDDTVLVVIEGRGPTSFTKDESECGEYHSLERQEEREEHHKYDDHSDDINGSFGRDSDGGGSDSDQGPSCSDVYTDQVGPHSTMLEPAFVNDDERSMPSFKMEYTVEEQIRILERQQSDLIAMLTEMRESFEDTFATVSHRLMSVSNVVKSLKSKKIERERFASDDESVENTPKIQGKQQRRKRQQWGDSSPFSSETRAVDENFEGRVDRDEHSTSPSSVATTSTTTTRILDSPSLKAMSGESLTRIIETLLGGLDDPSLSPDCMGKLWDLVSVPESNLTRSAKLALKEKLQLTSSRPTPLILQTKALYQALTDKWKNTSYKPQQVQALRKVTRRARAFSMPTTQPSAIAEDKKSVEQAELIAQHMESLASQIEDMASQETM